MVQIPFKEDFPGYLVAPEGGKHPGLIIIHEVWGLNDNIKDISERIAKEGFVVLAPDLLAGSGVIEKLTPDITEGVKNPATRDEAQKKMREATSPIHSPEFAEMTVEKLMKCVDFLLKNEAVNGEVAVLGFCFGGTYSYALAASDSRIKAAVPFYGHGPEPLDKVKDISCPVLAFYGEKDTRLVDDLPELEAKMKELGKDFQYKVYPNTGHAFFNDTNPTTYNKEAATDSWHKSLEFLRAHIKS